MRCIRLADPSSRADNQPTPILDYAGDTDLLLVGSAFRWDACGVLGVDGRSTRYHMFLPMSLSRPQAQIIACSTVAEEMTHEISR